jgi:hypothetical protein
VAYADDISFALPSQANLPNAGNERNMSDAQKILRETYEEDGIPVNHEKMITLSNPMAMTSRLRATVSIFQGSTLVSQSL